MNEWERQERGCDESSVCRQYFFITYFILAVCRPAIKRTGNERAHFITRPLSKYIAGCEARVFRDTNYYYICFMRVRSVPVHALNIIEHRQLRSPVNCVQMRCGCEAKRLWDNKLCIDTVCLHFAEHTHS